jgi:hypothetical protein
MNVYHITQLRDRGIATHQRADLLNDIRTMSAKGMTSKNTTGIGL